MLAKQKRKLRTAQSKKYPFALYLTLTTQGDGAVAIIVHHIIDQLIQVELPDTVIDTIGRSFQHLLDRMPKWAPTVVRNRLQAEYDKRVTERKEAFLQDIKEQLYNTLLLSIDKAWRDLPDYTSLEDLSLAVSTQFAQISKRFDKQGDIALIYVDFFAKTSVVEMAIRLTPAKDRAYYSPSHSPSAMQ